jgi:hypothetical protein
MSKWFLLRLEKTSPRRTIPGIAERRMGPATRRRPVASPPSANAAPSATGSSAIALPPAGPAVRVNWLLSPGLGCWSLPSLSWLFGWCGGLGGDVRLRLVLGIPAVSGRGAATRNLHRLRNAILCRVQGTV